jgi:hypothetical protein
MTLDPTAIDRELFGPSGRLNLYRWHRLPDTVKDQIYTLSGLHHLQQEGTDLCHRITDAQARNRCEQQMTELVPKDCRCIMELDASDLFRYGDITHNPYATCQASLSRSRSGLGVPPADIRSRLAVSSRLGECSIYLNLNKIPTTFLYAYAVQHLQTTKGRRFFDGKVPSLNDFLANREHWRPLLIQLIQSYIASAYHG